MVEYELPGRGQAEKEAGPESRETAVPAGERAEPVIESACDLAETFFERGIRYSTGKDVAPDLIAAHKWFNLAAQRGHAAARSYRNDLAREMTAREIAQAQREARAWIKREEDARRGRSDGGAQEALALVPAEDEGMSAAA